MANFCTKCGKPINECTCEAGSVFNDATNTGATLNNILSPSFFAAMKNKMGIGEPETNNAPLYEKNMQIVPDNVKANEGEIPIKQYNVAKLRNRIFGLTVSKANGRLQVTNKRLIFRAAGRCLRGRTTIQQEFAIDEIAGADVRREYSFTGWDIIIGIIIWALGVVAGFGLLSLLDLEVEMTAVLGFFGGVAALLPFFMVYQKFGLKLFALGASTGLFLSPTSINPFNYYYGAVDFFFVFAVISVIISLICLVIFSIKPNLVLTIKTKSSAEAIDIQRKRMSLPGFDSSKEDHTGYSEVLPAENVEEAIREICAIVSDIQKLGDYGIEKWKSQ